MPRSDPRRSGRIRLASLALVSLLTLGSSLAAAAQAPSAAASLRSQRQLAYPAGSTRDLLQLALLLGAGVLGLRLLQLLSGRRADQSSGLPATRSRRQGPLRIGYPEGMTFLEELQRQQRLEERLSPVGIDIIWSCYPSASTLLNALSRGQIDFCGGGGTASIFAQAAGQLFVRVAREKYPDLQGEAILVHEGSTIQSLRDLRGKRVAFDEGSSAHYVLIRALQIVGLTYHDIQPLPLPQNQALHRFRAGEVDAWVVWMPYAPTESRRSYPGRSIADLHSILGDRAAEEVPTLYYATPELVRDQPQLLKAILEELNEAGVQHNRQQLRLAEQSGLTTSSSSASPDAASPDGESEPEQERLESLRQRSIERAILPLDEPTLRSLQQQAAILQELRLVKDRINVNDGIYSLQMRQNWTY